MTNYVPLNLMKECFESQHYAALLEEKQKPKPATHDPALRLVGQLVAHTEDNDYIKKIIASALPENYEGNTLQELEAMVEGAVEKNYFMRIDKKSKSKATILLKAINDMKNVILFHNGFKDTYISLPSGSDSSGSITLPLSSTEAKRWLKKLYYELEGSPMPTQSFSEAHATLDAMALYDGPKREVLLRLGRLDNSICVNVGDDSGTTILVTPDKYQIITKSPLPFIKSQNMAALPLPAPGSDYVLEELQELLGMETHNFHRVLAFLINCMKPEGPYLFLLAQGEQGSGKSFLSYIIKSLIDPGPAAKLRLPSNERDLMIMAKQCHLLIFDNISGIKNNISDALCSLSTGGGFSTRKLYTDEELTIFNECRPYILNGISGIAHRPDLLERSLSIRLPSMPDHKRKTEAEMMSRFEELRPALLDKLLKITSTALRRFNEIEAPKDFRMADAAKWLLAAEPETGLPEGSLLQALKDSQIDVVKETMDNNSLAVALYKMLETHGPFDGTMGELHESLESYRAKYDKYFPSTSAHLSRTLDRLRPALEKAGTMVEFGPKKRRGKTIKIWFAEEGTFEEAMKKSDKENAISY